MLNNSLQNNWDIPLFFIVHPVATIPTVSSQDNSGKNKGDELDKGNHASADSSFKDQSGTYE